MTLARSIIFAVFALAACGPAPPTKAPASPHAIEPFDVQIEIGRYGVMIDQVASLTGEMPAAVDPVPTDLPVMARALRETVWEYNLARSGLCAKGLYPQASCGPVYEPVWTSEPADAAPTLPEIKARADAVGAEVRRFWDAVCADARSRAASQEEKSYVCAIE